MGVREPKQRGSGAEGTGTIVIGNQEHKHPRGRISRLWRGSSINEAVRDQIKQYILEQGLKAGDALPPETQWAQDLGVNRSSVREAVKALQSLGIIEIRHGHGLYVREHNFDPILECVSYSMQFEPSTLLELAQIRTWLEIAVLPQALDKMGPGDIAALENILKTWQAKFQTDAMDNILIANPNLNIVWGMYDEMALGALAAAKAHGLVSKIAILGYDNTPDAYEAIRRGEMHATVDTAPKEMGYNLIHAIKQYVVDGEVVPKTIMSEIAMWDQTNIHNFNTDNYRYVPFEAIERQPSRQKPGAGIAGLPPAWINDRGQFVSKGREVSVAHTGQEPLPTRKAGPIKVGFTPTAMNTHYDIVIAGARAAVDELGGSKIIDLVIQAPSSQSATAEQMDIVEDWIRQGFDAIAMCTANDRAMLPIYQKAAENGIPVFLFNTPLAMPVNPYYVSNVGYDQHEAGRLIGLWLVEHFGDRTTHLAILEGLPGVHNTERLSGFKEAIEGNENIKIVFSRPADWVRDKGQAVIDRVFQIEQDRQFHRALFAPLGNHSLVQLLDVFWTAFGDFLVNHQSEQDVDFAQHAAVLEAVKAGDPGRAQQALLDYLLRMQEHLRAVVASSQRSKY